MLPAPSHSRRRPAGAYALPNGIMSVLRQRTRLTNLAVALLCFLLLLSLVANVSHLVAVPQNLAGWEEVASREQLDSHRPPSLETTIHRDKRMGQLQHLVMVPGHAVWLGIDGSKAESNDDWVLEPMQMGGSVKTYIKHITRGAEILADDPAALLVFSGGATRSHLTSPIPEGLSYHRLAASLGLLPASENGDALSPSSRAVAEEYALDSYENLLYSIARFREVTGVWPAKITVVGYGMKRRRFEELHRGAIRFPAQHFQYIGIDDEGDTTEHFRGELKNGYGPFLHSPSGCRPPLADKRSRRNPFSRYAPYHSSVPELAGLFEWCPPSIPVGEISLPPNLLTPVPDMVPPEGFTVYEGSLPWDVSHIGRERD